MTYKVQKLPWQYTSYLIVKEDGKSRLPRYVMGREYESSIWANIICWLLNRGLIEE
jgi:hypothetical protein